MATALTTNNQSEAIYNNGSNGLHNINNYLSTTTSSPATTNASSNLYRVGDFVYIETSSQSPYQICKIEELIKNPNGNVEIKSICYYRRRDISGSLIQLAEKHQCVLEEEQEKELDQLPEKVRHQVKLRELYLSPQIETYPVQRIRGKCSVTLLSEAETLVSYLSKDDSFFYQLVYDPDQKTLVEADRGEIRVGQRYQAEVPPKKLEDPVAEDTRKLEELERMVYSPYNNLSDLEIDQFVIVAKSIGTYARALDCSSSVKQPNLHMSAASASRDITVQHAMDVLYKSDYDIAKAVCNLVPNKCPVLCRDEVEEWSSAEASLFEEGFEKYEKDFISIRQDFLPWKTSRNLIEYYYMWKTTDRYVQQKRVKAVENENKLKQVYIPNYNKQPIADDNQNDGSRFCESCKKNTWNSMCSWGPTQFQYYLCKSCWDFWKKLGAFKYPNRVADLNTEKLTSSSTTPSQVNNAVRPPPIADLNSQYPCRECGKIFNRQERLISHMASHRPHKCNVSSCGKEFKFKAHLARHCATNHTGAVPMRSGSPRPIMKTRAAFYYTAVPSLRLSRRICADILNIKSSARNPFISLNVAAFKQEYTTRFAKGISQLPKLCNKNRGTVSDVSHRLGTPRMPKPEWLIPTPKDQLPKPKKLTFPPTRPEDLNKIVDQVQPVNDNNRKRPIEQNGHSLPSKRRQMAPPSILGKSVPDLYENISRNSVSTSLNGRAKIATITNVSGKKQMISWVDAPDDVYFVANDKIKQMRRKMPLQELRRSARRPWKRCGKNLSASMPNSTTSSSSPATLPLSSNQLNLTPNAAAALAGFTGQLPTNSQQQVVAAALLQQQMLAQNLPLLTNNHFGSANSFLGMPSSNSNNGSTSKLAR